jgi:hypothetical protein
MLTWGLAGSGTVAVGGSVLTATHIVHAPPTVTVALCALSIASILSSSIVAIVKIRTERSSEIRRAERRATAMKKLGNQEHALMYDTLDEILTSGQVDHAEAEQCFKLMKQMVSQPKAAPDGTQTLRPPDVPAQPSSSETPSDVELQQMVSGTLKPDCDGLIPV